MGMIYKSAERVVIWLGEWPDLDTCSHFERCQYMWIERLGRWSDSSRREQDLILPSEHVCWHTTEVSKLPWFRRLWITQEFLLASCDPMVILGNLQIEWITFLDTTRECVDMHGENSASDVSENKQMDQPYNVVYKRVARTSEAPTPPTLITYLTMQLNHPLRL